MGAPNWPELFLEGLRKCGTVRAACEAAGVNRSTAYRRRMADPEFAREWDDALEDGIDALEEEARRRAVEGVLRPVYHGGKEVGAVREYSDILLIFLLKGARPWRFRDNYTPVPPLDLGRLSSEQLQRLAAGEHPLAVLRLDTVAKPQGEPVAIPATDEATREEG